MKYSQPLSPFWEVAQGSSTIVGRVLLVLIFLMSAVFGKIMNFSGTAAQMEANGVPLPKVALVGAIVFLLVGSFSIIIGYKARYGAALLLIFLILASFFFHDFWNIPPDARYTLNVEPYSRIPVAQLEMGNFMKNMALMGAMLFIMANGSGVMSLDNWLRSRRNP